MEPEESPSWQERIDAVWAAAQTMSDDEVLQAVTTLAAERPDDDPAAAFELASAYDFIGQEAQAEPAYRRALGLGLEGLVRTRAIIQLASSLRNLERLEESRLLLAEELAANPDAYLRDSVVAFLGLTLIDLGQEKEAAILSIAALAPHLHGYRRAIDHYISELSEPSPAHPVDPEAAPADEGETAENSQTADDSEEPSAVQ